MGAWATGEPATAQVHATAVGELKPIALGTRGAVHVNTDSELVVRTMDGQWEAVLRRGEALFDIDRDDGRQLHVFAGNAVVHADAAAVGVSIRVHEQGHVDVLVREGRVTIDAAPAAVPAHLTILSNQLAHISPAGVTVDQLSATQVARKLLWTSGYLCLSGETLEEAVAEFSRYNNRKLVIADRTISALTIGGKFLTTDLESFVAALRPMGVRALEPEIPGPTTGAIRLVGAKGRR
jgi:transmembrane sensor